MQVEGDGVRRRDMMAMNRQVLSLARFRRGVLFSAACAAIVIVLIQFVITA